MVEPDKFQQQPALLTPAVLIEMVDHSGLNKVIDCLSSGVMVLFTALLFSAPVPASTKILYNSGEVKHVITPGEDYELCADLLKNQKIKYNFKASWPLIFNLHYHVGDTIKYPVRSSMVVRRSAVYIAEKDHEYCLMWTNLGKKTINLELSYEIETAR